MRIRRGKLTDSPGISRSGLLGLALSFGLLAPVAADMPQPYRAEYQAKASGMSATAYRSLEQLAPERYRLSNSLSLTVVGATVGGVLETSEFIHAEGALRPMSYLMEQSGISRRKETVGFDWEQMVAVSAEGRDTSNLSISEGVMDKLSFTAQLALDLAALAPEERVAGREFTYRIVDGDDVDEHRYGIVGVETLETPAGAMETLKLERIRAPESRRKTTFWLAPGQDFLLVKFEQVSGSGSATELLLQSYRATSSVAGQ